jgi:hypothetical protein
MIEILVENHEMRSYEQSVTSTDSERMVVQTTVRGDLAYRVKS